MEQNMRFGLILGRLAILKKKIEAVFFHVRTKKFYNITFIKKILNFKKNILAKNMLSIHNHFMQLFSADTAIFLPLKT